MTRDELIEELRVSAVALENLRLICGSAGRIHEADAYLLAQGFTYPFTGFRNPPPQSIPEGTE